MKFLVGDKNRLALESTDNKDDSSFGRLFLYVNGIRFGQDNFDFEVDAMIESTLSYFKVYGVNLVGLASCPPNELFDSYYKVSSFDEENDDISSLGAIEATKYFPDFVENFVDVDNCVFRYVDYAFDRSFILLIPASDELKLYIKDDDSGVCTSIMTTTEEFLGLWKEMAVKRSGDV
ncbi:MAG: hypothetical protein KZQ94_20700 [Candidatus Thiodiazotropha sp. (ex Troendleina suluensis)]|nr:hypothetical protein [Candidatus Thiodiazotropha sp. (ex Troendleina suluensis)]